MRCTQPPPHSQCHIRYAGTAHHRSQHAPHQAAARQTETRARPKTGTEQSVEGPSTSRPRRLPHLGRRHPVPTRLEAPGPGATGAETHSGQRQPRQLLIPRPPPRALAQVTPYDHQCIRRHREASERIHDPEPPGRLHGAAHSGQGQVWHEPGTIRRSANRAGGSSRRPTEGGKFFGTPLRRQVENSRGEWFRKGSPTPEFHLECRRPGSHIAKPLKQGVNPRIRTLLDECRCQMPLFGQGPSQHVISSAARLNQLLQFLNHRQRWHDRGKHSARHAPIMSPASAPLRRCRAISVSHRPSGGGR